MLKEFEAVKQVNRLASMPRFGEMMPEGRAELVRAIRKFPDVESAESAITEWLQLRQWLPVPADLYSLAEAATNSAGVVRPSKECETCNGSGFARILVLVTFLRHPSGHSKRIEEQQISPEAAANIKARLGDGQQIHTAVRACGCEYGQYLKAGRIRYEIEQAEKSTGKGKR